MSDDKKNEEVQSASEVNLPTRPTSEFLDRAKIELELRPLLRQEYETAFQIWKNNELSELAKKQDEVIAEGLKKYFETWKEEQKPPEPEDIQKLLNQEYETFVVPIDAVKYENGEEVEEKLTFTIRELPQSIEKKFYKQFREKLIDKLQMLEAVTQAGMDKPFEERVKAGLTLFDESFDILAQAVVYCLNPFGRKSFVTVTWVQDHIGSDRQWRIVEAQMKVNRLRDFFSKVSTSGRNLTMTRSPNFQALQQLAV